MIIDLEKPKKIEAEKTKGKLQSRKVSTLLKELSSGKNKETPAPKTYVVIDYPSSGEKIQPGHYAVRIGASGGGTVQFSIDGGDWKDCRPNAGYYWYDWVSIPQGNHKISARIQISSGKYKKSKIVRCTVE